MCRAARKMCIMMLISIFQRFVSFFFVPIAKLKEGIKEGIKMMVSRNIFSVDYVYFFREGIMMNLFLVFRFPLCFMYFQYGWACCFFFCAFIIHPFQYVTRIPSEQHREEGKKYSFFNSSCFTLSPPKLLFCVFISLLNKLLDWVGKKKRE